MDKEDIFKWERLASKVLKDKKLYKWLHQMWGGNCPPKCEGCYYDLRATTAEILRIAVKKKVLKVTKQS